MPFFSPQFGRSSRQRRQRISECLTSFLEEDQWRLLLSQASRLEFCPCFTERRTSLGSRRGFRAYQMCFQPDIGIGEDCGCAREQNRHGQAPARGVRPIRQKA
jgi:hypothetical protein